MTKGVCLSCITESTKVGENNGVYKKSVPEYPLLITPIASGQLRHQEAVFWTLVIHQLSARFIASIRKSASPVAFRKKHSTMRNRGVVSLAPRFSGSCTRDGICPWTLWFRASVSRTFRNEAINFS